MSLVRVTDSMVEPTMPGLQDPQRRRRVVPPERRPTLLVHGEVAEAMSVAMTNDRGRFRKFHGGEVGHQHTLCSLWLDYAVKSGMRFPPYGDDPVLCKRCQSVARNQLRRAGEGGEPE